MQIHMPGQTRRQVAFKVYLCRNTLTCSSVIFLKHVLLAAIIEKVLL